MAADTSDQALCAAIRALEARLSKTEVECTCLDCGHKVMLPGTWKHVPRCWHCKGMDTYKVCD